MKSIFRGPDGSDDDPRNTFVARPPIPYFRSLVIAVATLVALVFFFMPRVDMEGRTLYLGQNAYLGGCLALMLMLYNVVRWWSVRSWAAQQQAIRQALEQVEQWVRK